MTIKMETISHLPDIKSEVLPDEFGMPGTQPNTTESHNTHNTQTQPSGQDLPCQWSQYNYQPTEQWSSLPGYTSSPLDTQHSLTTLAPSCSTSHSLTNNN